MTTETTETGKTIFVAATKEQQGKMLDEATNEICDVWGMVNIAYGYIEEIKDNRNFSTEAQIIFQSLSSQLRKIKDMSHSASCILMELQGCD